MRTMYRHLIRLGQQKPYLQASLRPVLDHVIRMASTVLKVEGADRKQYADLVFEMGERTYRSIGGMPISSPGALMKYQVWEINFADGEPVAFTLFKKTRYGLKGGLSGFDGSPAGKSIQISNLRSKFKQPGIYGEVSHKVEDIALAGGAKPIPAKYVGAILGKDIEEDEDGYHYWRTISGLGRVRKILVGNPKGIPTREAGVDEHDAMCDRHAHLSCVAF